MDITDLIEDEHRELGRLARQLAQAQRQDSSALVEEVANELVERFTLHVEVEEEILHPAAQRSGPELAELVQRGRAAHRDGEELLSGLAGRTAGAPLPADLAGALIDLMDKHAAETENVLFPCLRRERADQLVSLGLRYRAVRRNAREDAKLPQLLAFILNRESCCIDIGCNGGVVLEQMLRCAPDGRHIAFEPIPTLAGDLRRRFPTVDVRQAAVSDQDGRATFVHVTADAAYSGLRERPSSLRGWPDHIGRDDLEEIVVRTERLDSVLPDGFVPDLIKIDVEGAEGLVLSGAMDTIATHRPTIVFEHEGVIPAYGTESSDIWDLLVREAGLRIYDFDGRGPYTRDQFALSAHRLDNTNYLARR
ncbi:FkbM family methyltransferase [Kitasatospora aureofaciens]|uniref:FkbM family methyltransferase n=1 Tax=Kitasatospora aureofaciens TaxID=1894 RepID=UPI0037C8F8EC